MSTTFTWDILKSLDESYPELVPLALKLEEAAKERGRRISHYNVMLVLKAVSERWPEHLDDVQPYVNVLTFHDWKKLKRAVKKGEKAIELAKFFLFIFDPDLRDQWKKMPKGKKKDKFLEEYGTLMPSKKNISVFCLWQTETIQERVALAV